MAELKVDIVGDASGLTKSIDQATSSMKKMEKASGEVESQLTKTANAIQGKLSKEIKGLTGLEKTLGNGFDASSAKIRAYQRAIKELSQAGFTPASARIQTLNKELQSLDKPLSSVRTGSKRTSASLIEFSRVIGDAPYGIRGVANNLQQLAFTMGLGGPAILAITAITAGLDFFMNRTDKAAKEIESLGDRAQEAAGKLNPFAKAMNEGAVSAETESAQLRGLYAVVQDTTRSIGDRTAAVDALQKLFPDYFGSLTNEQILTGKAAAAYDALTKSIRASAVARVAQGELDTAVADIRNREVLIDSYEREQKLIDRRIEGRVSENKEGRTLGDILKNQLKGEEDIIDLINQRKDLDRQIVDVKAEIIPLNGSIRKLEKEITDQTIAKTKAEEKYVKEKKKGAKIPVRETIKDISTKDLKIVPAMVEGAQQASKTLEKGLKDAWANAFKLSEKDFLSLQQSVKTGAPVGAVQPDLRGPKGSIIKPVADDTKNLWETLAADMESNMSQSIRSFGNELSSVFRELELTGRGAFTNIMDGLRVTLNAALANAVQSVAGSIGSKVGADVGASVGKSVSKSLGDTVGGILGPGIGTLVGGVITGLGSLIGGLFGRGKRRREAEKQAEIQKQQLEEQKRMAKELERQSALAYTSSIIGKMLPGFGSVSNIDINSMGQLTARVDGKDLLFVLNRAESSNKRGI